MSKETIIAPTAKVDDSAHLSEGVQIDALAEIGPRLSIGARTHIMERANISGFEHGRHGGIIQNDVVVGPGVTIYAGTLVMHNAVVCPNDVSSVSSHGRLLMQNVSIGPGVLLHDEVELGDHAIVPTQRTIAMLGNFGSKNRVVTVYGADFGPRYSIGCQVGVSMAKFQEHVDKAAHTSEVSAATYQEFMDVFKAAGDVVQQAYQREAGLVEEIRGIRQTNELPILRNVI